MANWARKVSVERGGGLPPLFSRFLGTLKYRMLYEYESRVSDYVKEVGLEEEEWYRVHEVSQCRRKAMLLRRFRELREIAWSNPAISLGELIHRGVSDIAHLAKGEPVHRAVPMGRENVFLIGIPDLVDESGYRVVEVKTAAWLKELPNPHHVMQLALYLWILDFPEGEIWDLARNGLTAFTISASFEDEDVAELIAGWPSPRWEWECEGYCAVRVLCPRVVAAETEEGE